MNSDLIFNIIIAIGVIIGLFGGIPKIRELLKPKPSFKVIENKLMHSKEKDYTHFLINIENDGNALATEVGFRWAILQKDSNEIVYDSQYRIDTIGLLAPKTSKTQIVTCKNIDPSYTYDVWVRIQCSEGIYEEKRFPLIFEQTD